MRAHRVFERIGLGEGPRDDTFAWRILLAACLLYAVGFACFYPDVVVNDDESAYMNQAVLVLERTAVIPKLHALTGQILDYYPSRYPHGTALTMAVPMAVAGWRGGYVVPCASLLAAVLLLGHWLRREGRSPLFALLVLGYPPALVLGRVAMSDAPSLFVVTLGLWLFWRGSQRAWPWWLASGFVAGSSTLFRESNPFAFAPFFAGALLRRERNVWGLVAGGLLGLALRAAVNTYFFGEAFYYRTPYELALATLPDRLLVYAVALLVFVPGGLLLALLYRGRRWPELCIAVAGFVTAYLAQVQYTFASSLLKNLVIAPRYLIPIVPLIAFGMAESVPRLWRRWLEVVPAVRRERLRAAAGGVLVLWIGGIGLASFAVHPAFAIWGAGQSAIRDAIHASIDPELVLVTNFPATHKFLPALALKYAAVDRGEIHPETFHSLVRRHREVYIVFLDRSDSDYWRQDAIRNAEFIRKLRPQPELTLDRQITATDHLRIWRVRLDDDRPG